jgi:hypothetical protein
MKKRVRKARLLAMKNVPVVEVVEEVKPKKKRASKKKEA